MNNRAVCMIATVGLIVFASGSPCPGAGWRGDGMGRYPDADPALEWAADKNIIWVTPTKDWSHAMPAVGDERIFITAEPFLLIGLNKADGKMLWQADHEYEHLPPSNKVNGFIAAERIKGLKNETKRNLENVRKELNELGHAETKDENKIAKLKSREAILAKRFDQRNERYEAMAEYKKPGTSPNCGYASASPVTDGRRVWVVFGNSVAACYDQDGARQWMRIIDRPGKEGFGHSSSPLLVDDMFVIQMDDLAAHDADTGELRWRTDVDVMPGTPVMTRLSGKAVIVAPSGHIIRAEDGALLAHVKTGTVVFNSPIVHDGVVYFASNMKGVAMAVQLPDKAEPFEPQILWKTTVIEDKHYYSSPVYHKGLLYTLAEFEGLSALDATTGELLYTRKLEISTAFPSITVAGDHVLVTGQGGITYVLEPKREYAEVAKNKLESFRSTPVFEGTRMYVRAKENVYCIGR